jgi:hypothetical protein
MEALATLPNPSAAKDALAPLVSLYREWINQQRQAPQPTLTARRRETTDELLRRASVAADRIEAGIARLQDAHVFEAFRIANRVMARHSRCRSAVRHCA